MVNEKKVPYISFSVERLPDFLDLILKLEPIEKKDLLLKTSLKFKRSKKTMEEFILSLKNLNLIIQKNNLISTSELSKKMVSISKENFWELLRENILRDKNISSILDAIIDITKQRIKVKSNENYYNQLSNILKDKYGFTFASARMLDRFITLFRKTNILNYDPFCNEYFLVSKHSISDDELFKIVKREYNKIKNILEKKTGTDWVPIDQLNSQVCRKEGIEMKLFNEFMKRALKKGKLQFAEASASRNKVRERGIEKNGSIYFYVKIPKEVSNY